MGKLIDAVKLSAERFRDPADAPLFSRDKVYHIRQTGRIIRYIEPWSAFKVSLIFNLALWVIFLIAGAILWGVALAANIIQRLENFMTDLLALESYDLPFNVIYLVYSLGGLAVALILTAATVFGCIIFNQISSLFGGIRVLVLEEETLKLVSAKQPESNSREQHFQDPEGAIAQ